MYEKMGWVLRATHLGAAVGSHATEAEQAQPKTILVVHAVENYTCLRLKAWRTSA